METIDLRGTRCPLTLLKIKQYLYSSKNQAFAFLCDDKGARVDLPVYLARDAHWSLELIELDDYFEARCRLKVDEKRQNQMEKGHISCDK